MNGHLSLIQDSILKGLFGAKSLRIGSPGRSTTFTDVPLGPGILVTTSLILFANSEPLVVGTMKVAVAPFF